MKTKEAIERVRSRFDKWSLDNEDLTALQALGLVDVESEDERIRKDIIGGLMWQKDNLKSEGPHDNNLILPGFCFSVGAHLAYLGRQKHSLNFDAISSWLRDHASNYVNREYNEFHHCVEYDGTINVEKLIADLKVAVDIAELKVAVDGGTFDVYEQKEQMPIHGYDNMDDLIADAMIDEISESDMSDSAKHNRIYWISKHKQKPAEIDEYKIIEKHITEDSLSSEVNKRLKECGWYVTDEKPVECIEFDNEFKNQVSHLLASVLNKEWNYTKGFVEYTAQQLLGYAKHEIKTVKWSEEDDAAHTRILGAIAKAFMGVLPTKPSEEDVNWLKTLPERFNLQPKREWSEENEKFIKDLCNLLAALAKDNRVGCYYAPDLINKINSLRPQPHTASMKDATKFGNLEYERGVKDGIQSEKSHHWKPSKEQMEALKHYVDTTTDGEIELLYNDLKKLI